MGAIAMIAGLVLNLDKAAELVNFGACAGFMVVNLSVIGHYFVRRREGWWGALVVPAIGFAICLWIWLSVSPLAMKVGGLWTVVGFTYLVILMRRHGMRLSASAPAR
jgi:amino acid transporter